MEQNKPRLLARFSGWIGHHRTLTYLIAGIGLIIVGVAVAFAFWYQTPQLVDTPQPVAEQPKPAPEPAKYYSPLTGTQLTDENATKQPVTAVMIENSPDARPQSGLKDSGVVFEAIAEGGITRFLVLYQEQKPQLIGPVRSVRMYYVDWLAAFNASVAHVGGSANALAEVRNGNYRDIDQFFNSGTYWRATDRYAPHNVYTSFAKIDALNVSKGFISSAFTGFTRTDTPTPGLGTATSINVTISGALYNSSYTYDATSNSYLRSQAGAPHTDREQRQISPKVVIAMRVDETTVLEDGYRQNIVAIGSGGAIIFQNGTAQQVTWTKSSRAAQIVFTDATGKDVPLTRGQTWISAVPNHNGDVTWQ